MFLLALVTQAQIKTPAPSPMQTLEQTVGLTDVTLKYSRPSVKGRTIFGGLVPFDAMWRTGANQNSMITFSDDVLIGEATSEGRDLCNFHQARCGKLGGIFL